MAVVHKTVFIGYSAAQMFALVEQVEKYPEFLPWCGEVKVAERSETNLIATLAINFHGIKQSFTTKNINQPPHSMQMNLVDGPFRQLTGGWKFTELRPDACKIEFDLNYDFSSKLLEHLIGPVFSKIANSFVDSFCSRAEAIYA
ncbi:MULTISPECIES: type II toxin-antitoxin system RatA family toxin [Undibacterium]|jgi:ribosome-associated toxin RatA of RatAB toxin-antitoxin module|uniref:Type II toxin-antitoxin system RatA family toxin n=1 Tax=Undibacterium aquatile TaxID=1537398 RepID=A0ABR6XDK4_9BURK|nr:MULTISPECIES: type II toxin-antitoxin system RatA family toxin [Undibacterium]MBC3810808.1 type II toxin-antitoxin system RatA family toxin [Undibacterium aquatile]MBC3928286.1 type II toxin-antitoxin system RatA family toxin [Undibacterium sp. CY21W]MBK1890949.1 type II toxin-antitoxin system RatA family toxin [Undibacterium sp. 14-3-2]MBY0571185.1 type II toxin-antitoxin system RatA family toxin [Burkholderiaceae bacterium]